MAGINHVDKGITHIAFILEINWQVDEIVSSTMALINSSHKHLGRVLVRNVLYHQCCSVVLPTLDAVNIKFILFPVTRSGTTFTSTASSSFAARVKQTSHSQLAPCRMHCTSLAIGQTDISRRDRKVHTSSTDMRKHAMGYKIHLMQTVPTSREPQITKRTMAEGRGFRRSP
uniref:Uncharacterized protein n=1 Tax=Opuntia streptacantha TaxID=393608 RepID=A0A7C9DJJ9_OPUST